MNVGDQKKTLLRIDELYAFIAQDADGEGLPAFMHNGMMLPMVCADKARVDSLREMARMMARESGNKITLCRFSVREEIEVIEPGIEPGSENAARAYSKIHVDDLYRLQLAFGFDRAAATSADGIAFCDGRLALIAAELKRRGL